MFSRLFHQKGEILVVLKYTLMEIDERCQYAYFLDITIQSSHTLFCPPKRLWRDLAAVLCVLLSTMLPIDLFFGGLIEKEPAKTVRPLRGGILAEFLICARAISAEFPILMYI
jgi:hypothetical protein